MKKYRITLIVLLNKIGTPKKASLKKPLTQTVTNNLNVRLSFPQIGIFNPSLFRRCLRVLQSVQRLFLKAKGSASILNKPRKKSLFNPFHSLFNPLNTSSTTPLKTPLANPFNILKRPFQSFKQ